MSGVEVDGYLHAAKGSAACDLSKNKDLRQCHIGEVGQIGLFIRQPLKRYLLQRCGDGVLVLGPG